MRALKNKIQARQREQRDHHLFALLQTTTSREALATMARAVAWWPMVFQDVLRLNFDRLQGSGFEHFADHHRKEDAGHDRWFIDDLRTFGVDELTLDTLFADDFQPIRDTCYTLVSEVLRDQAPAQRVAMLLAVEATGHVYFENAAAATARVCPDLELRYLSHFHLGVEKDHDLFTEETEADVDEIALSDEERRSAEAAIDRIFDTFDSYYSYVFDRMSTTVRNTSYIRELGASEVAAAIPLRRAR